MPAGTSGTKRSRALKGSGGGKDAPAGKIPRGQATQPAPKKQKTKDNTSAVEGDRKHQQQRTALLKKIAQGSVPRPATLAKYKISEAELRQCQGAAGPARGTSKRASAKLTGAKDPPQPDAASNELQLPPKMTHFLTSNGVTELAPRLAAVLKPLADGKDVLASGSGAWGDSSWQALRRSEFGACKCHAYLAPVLEYVARARKQQGAARYGSGGPECLVIVPDSSSGYEVLQEIQAHHLGLGHVYAHFFLDDGAVLSYHADLLAKRTTEIAIGTPDRLRQLLLDPDKPPKGLGFLMLDRMRYVVVEGADKLGKFQKDVSELLMTCRMSEEYHTVVYAASGKVPAWLTKQLHAFVKGGWDPVAANLDVSGDPLPIAGPSGPADVVVLSSGSDAADDSPEEESDQESSGGEQSTERSSERSAEQSAEQRESKGALPFSGCSESEVKWMKKLWQVYSNVLPGHPAQVIPWAEMYQRSPQIDDDDDDFWVTPRMAYCVFQNIVTLGCLFAEHTRCAAMDEDYFDQIPTAQGGLLPTCSHEFHHDLQWVEAMTLHFGTMAAKVATGKHWTDMRPASLAEEAVLIALEQALDLNEFMDSHADQWAALPDHGAADRQVAKLLELAMDENDLSFHTSATLTCLHPSRWFERFGGRQGQHHARMKADVESWYFRTF